MTREHNIAKIKAACVKANQSIMDLKFGCEVEEKPAFGSGFRGYTYNGGKVFPYSGLRANTGDYLFLIDGGMCHVKESELTSWHKILGRKLTLADVLLALSKKAKEEDEMHKTSVRLVSLLQRGFGEVVGYWILDDDDLTHQTDETLEFIANLLP